MKRLWIIFALLNILLSIPTIYKDYQFSHAQGYTDNLAFLENKKTWTETLLERVLSTQNRIIHIYDMEKSFSANPSIAMITIADKNGIWLRLKNVQIAWNRLSLLKGEISINQIFVQNIEMLRKPGSDGYAAAFDAQYFSLPHLPVSIRLSHFFINQAYFAEPVFQLASTVKIQGSIDLDRDVMKAKLEVNHLDHEGQLFLNADYEKLNKKIDVDLSLKEEKNGILTNILEIPERPAIDLTLKSEGNLENAKFTLAVLADKKNILNGQITAQNIFEKEEKLALSLNGAFAQLMPEEYRTAFEGNTSLYAEGSLPSQGGVTINRVKINNQALKADIKARILNDGFLRYLDASLNVAQKDNMPFSLPFINKETSFKNFALNIHYGFENQNEWQGLIKIADLKNENFQSHDVTVKMGGFAENLDDKKRRYVKINAKGEASGISTQKEEIATALNHKICMQFSGDLYGSAPIVIKEAFLAANTMRLELKGKIQNEWFKGAIQLNAPNLEPLGIVLREPLKGDALINAYGAIALHGGALRMRLNGKIKDIKTQNPTANAIFKNPIEISGSFIRDKKGIITRFLNLKNDQIVLSSNGIISSDKANIDLALKLNDMGAFNKNISGPIEMRISGRGHNRFINFAIKGAIPDAILRKKKLKDFSFISNVTWDKLALQKNYLKLLLQGEGKFNGKDLAFHGDFSDGIDGKNLKNFYFIMQGTRLFANLTQTKNHFYQGNVSVDSQDISHLTDLFFLNGKGALKADLKFDKEGNSQSLRVKSQIRNINIENNSIKTLDVNTNIKDLYHNFKIDGSLNAENVHFYYKNNKKTSKDFTIYKIAANALQIGEETKFTIESAAQDNLKGHLEGLLKQENEYKKLTFTNLSLKRLKQKLNLMRPAFIEIKKKDILFSNWSFKSDQGSINIDGVLNDQISLNIDLNRVPLAFVNNFFNTSSLEGEATGTLLIKGEKTHPDIFFNVSGKNITNLLLQKENLKPFNLQINGKTKKDHVELTAAVESDNIAFSGKGSLTFNNKSLETAPVNAIFTIQKLPAALIENLIPFHGLDGALAGNIWIKGSFQDPEIAYKLTSPNLSLNLLDRHSITPIKTILDGSYKKLKFFINTLTLKAPKALNIKANGNISIADKNLDLFVEGNLPTEITNQILTRHGAKISGPLYVKTSLKGLWNKPDMQGIFTVQNGSLFEVVTNIGLKNLMVSGRLNGQDVLFDKIQGQSISGGSVYGDGKITLDPEQNLPSVFHASLNNYKYSYDTIVITTIEGPLYIHGPLLHNPIIEGQIKLLDTEIVIPRKINNSHEIDIEHKYLTPPILHTIQRAQPDRNLNHSGLKEESENIAQLKIRVSAPNNVFVRGSGLNVELGGSLNVTGPVTHVHPVGDLHLIRGRYDIGPQKINFDTGQLSFTGNIDPDLTLTGQTTGNDIVVNAQVSGTITNMHIKFTSQPELPQDEIFAHLLFNTSLNELTPFQLAQLAVTVAEITGISSSFIGALRSHTGLSDFDIITDKEGNMSIKAGRYIKNNLYLGMETGKKGRTKGDINFNITKSLKTKGSLSVDGQSSLGVFFEKDY